MSDRMSTGMIVAALGFLGAVMIAAFGLEAGKYGVCNDLRLASRYATDSTLVRRVCGQEGE
jgi:hypothetical protein